MKTSDSPSSTPVHVTDSRVRRLEEALARTALAYHFQHVMAKGPAWDDCEHPICVAARQLLPTLRSRPADHGDRVVFLSTRRS